MHKTKRNGRWQYRYWHRGQPKKKFLTLERAISRSIRRVLAGEFKSIVLEDRRGRVEAEIIAFRNKIEVRT
jgi:hypothetical protein